MMHLATHPPVWSRVVTHIKKASYLCADSKLNGSNREILTIAYCIYNKNVLYGFFYTYRGVEQPGSSSGS